MKITERLNVLRELMKEKRMIFMDLNMWVITLNVENISQVLQDRREQL